MNMTTAPQQTATTGSGSSNAMKVMLSILCPLQSGGTVVHKFSLDARCSLEWFKKNADELARTIMPDAHYTALFVEPITSVSSATSE